MHFLDLGVEELKLLASAFSYWLNTKCSPISGQILDTDVGASTQWKIYRKKNSQIAVPRPRSLQVNSPSLFSPHVHVASDDCF